ncbi:MAG TPA: hypothetical protein VIH67_11890 [Candidatus Acidoferrum sp.]
MPDIVDPSTLRALSVAGISVTAAIALSLLFLLTGRGQEVYFRIEQMLSRFAERRLLASCVLFLSVVGVRLLALPLLPVPIPSIHDEFSYLLMADTFAHGRLTNPTHPLWMSLETFHVNWHPTYSSMYPPAQGFILAIGQLLGHPWIGVLLSNAAMCVAIFWALQAWMPARWAFLAASITALKFGITSYWVNSYWGGAAAAIGGALVLGGLGRLRRRTRARDAILLAFGAAILANSRPYEGLFFCLPAALWFSFWLTGKIRSKEVLRSRLRNALLPVVCVLSVTATFIAYYNWRLTGDALLFPHTLNERAYEAAPLFLWQPFRPMLHYNNIAFQSFYNTWERSHYQTDWKHAIYVSREKVDRFKVTYFWAGALLILPAVPFVLRDRRLKLFWVTLAVVTAAIFAVIWSQAHYAAPLTCIFYGLLVQAIRHLRTMRVSSLHFGVALSRVIVLLLVLDTGTNLCYRVCDALAFSCGRKLDRAMLVEKLRHMEGKHLIIVRYAEFHNYDDEWVFNGADIDAAKVVWARELDAQQNAKLFAYFKDRKIWLVTPDADTIYLEPYTPPSVE